MNTNKIDIQLKYKDYFNPEFSWSEVDLYTNNIDLFTEEFIELFKDKINWVCFCQFTAKYISPKLKLKYKKHLVWLYYESIYVGLTSNDIEQLLKEEHLLTHELNWDFISRECILSEQFIIKHKKQVNWHYINEEQKLSDKFKQKYHIALTYDSLGSNFYQLPWYKRLIYKYKIGIINNMVIK